MIWETITDDEDKINDDIRNGLPTGKPIYPAHRGVPVPDRSVHGGWAMSEDEKCDEEKLDSIEQKFLALLAEEEPDHPWVLSHLRDTKSNTVSVSRIITPELAFVAIMVGFGLVLIVGALLGIVEVGHE